MFATQLNQGAVYDRHLAVIASASAVDSSIAWAVRSRTLLPACGTTLSLSR
jgi:hypothetical protein